MATDEEIRAEIEKLGRLTPEQERILYNLSLRQDELGRQTTNLLLDNILGSDIYMPMIEREYLTYEAFDKAKREGAPIVASLYVTLKGLRYCIMFKDEISETLPYDVVGLRKK